MKKILVCRETDPRETRTPLIPDDVKRLISMGYEVTAVKGTGVKSGFPDEAYEKAGARLVSTNEEGYKGSEIAADNEAREHRGDRKRHPAFELP